MNPSRALTPFESRWLAEVVRLHEARLGPLEDARAVVEARRALPELETRICRRAEVLGEREGWRDAILRWHARARLVLVGAGVIALIVGFGTAAAVLGDGTRPVNVVWALGGLLGLHLISLLLWLAGLAFARSRAELAVAGGLGGAWLRLVSVFDRRALASDLPLALTALLTRSRMAVAATGAVSHLLWLLALLGAALGLVVLLATRRYGFVWETTILPADAFVVLTKGLGTVPAAFGFPVPDAAQVAASGAAANMEDGTRHAWSGWLLGCVIAYGVVPRLILAGACALQWRRALGRLRLDLSLPEYMRLRLVLLPPSERTGIRDAAPGAAWRPARARRSAPAAGAALMLALELGDDLEWPPEACAALAHDGGRLDGREQRRDRLARLAAEPVGRLLIVIDPRLTPDRGALGLIAELAARAGETRVWAMQLAGTRADRLALWQEAVNGLGFEADALLRTEAAVVRWLEEGA